MQPEFETEIIRKKEQIRGSLFRANSLAVFLVAVLVLLGIGAVVQAFRAEQAEAAATDKLWESYLTQARALRFSGQPGRKQQILEAVKAAAKIRPSPELRDEAVAALAMKDLVVGGEMVPVKAHRFEAAFEKTFSKYLLTHGGRFVVRDWQTHSNIFEGNLEHGIAGHMLSAKGNYLVLREFDGTHHVWDLREKVEILNFKDTSAVGGLDISADEKTLAVVMGNEVAFFDLDEATEMERFTLPISQAGVKFAPNGRTLAFFRAKVVEIARFTDYKLRRVRRIESPEETMCGAWSADGRHFAAGGMNWNIYVWDITSGAFMTLRGHSVELVSLEFSPVEPVLMSYSWDGTTRFWNAMTGDLLLTTHQGWGRTWSEDGKTIGFFKHNAGVGRWRFEYSEALRTLDVPIGTQADVRVLEFSRDGSFFIAGNASRLMAVRTENGEIEAEIPQPDLKGVAFAPDDRTLMVSTHKRIDAWEYNRGEGGEIRMNLRQTTPSPEGLPLGQIRVTELGKRMGLIVGGKVFVFKGTDLSSRESIIMHRNSGSLDFSPDESKVVTGSWYGEGAAVYEAATGKKVQHLDSRDADVYYSKDGRWIAVGGSDAYRFFDASSYSNVWTLERDSAAQTSAVSAWSPETGRLAITVTGVSQEIVDLNNKRLVVRLVPPFEKKVGLMEFSPNGRHLAVTTADRTIYLWNLQKLEQGLKKLGLNLDPISDQRPEPRKERLLPYTILFIAAMLGALALAWIALKRHRGLLVEYNQAEMDVLRRNRELEIARAELAHSQKMKALGTLAAGIAHDFNNLLSIIRMANQLTAREAGSKADVKENSQVIEEAVRQGKQVVKSMLGYSRENDGRAQMISIPELVEDLVPLLSKQFLSGISLKLELDYEMPRVQTVPQRLEQILLNLIVNASEALGGQGRLSICAELVEQLPGSLVLRPKGEGEFVRISVVDNGPGIPPEILDRIFEPFFTTKNTGSNRGTGLGLSIVYTIAEEEGYGIGLENRRGEGAAFHIFVPANSVPLERRSERSGAFGVNA